MAKTHIVGSDANELIPGSDKNDHLFGRSGHDGLVGNAGNDRLIGGEGRDLMLGGSGNDQLEGESGNDVYLIRRGTGMDLIKGFEAGDRIDLRDFGFSSFDSVLDATRQSRSDVIIDLGNHDRLLVQNVTIDGLAPEQFVVTSEIQGPSSSASPYVVSSDSNVYLESLLTVGDTAGGYAMVGIPDGLGAFDNGDGTFTLLVNHELGAGSGVVRAHGATGAFVSEWVIDKTTLEVLSGQDLMIHSWMYDPLTQTYVDHSAALGNGIAFDRFCAAELADQSAFYNPLSGLGYNGGMLYLNGEESGTEGRAMAHIVGGPENGNSYELAWLGNMAYENLIANPHSGDKTVVGVTDDGLNGQVYFYYGDKTSTGNAIDQAGLTGGNLYGIQVADFLAISNNAPSTTVPLGADNESGFSLINLGNVSAMTGLQLDTASEAAGVTSFLRPEDGAWDTVNPDRFYFVTTNSFTQPSQLWALDFVDASNPALGGTIKLLLDGSEGQRMLDNITVDQQGHVLLQEDPGNQAYLARVWDYDPITDALNELAVHDADRFTSGGTSFLTQDEESSGIIDVTHILGNAGEQVFLLGVQAHYSLPGELVQGGQLLVMHEYLV